MKFLSRVLAAIRPSPEEMSGELEFTKIMVDHIAGNAPPGCQVVLTGSMAKKTFLRDKRDIDIFVLFDRSFPREGLEGAVRRIMDSAFPLLEYQLSYAEHPYVRFHFEGRRIDLVPAYRITDSSERISAVDRSVLHTDFIIGALKPGQIGDVLLLKQFLRANSLYGAEIKIQGLSGYLCELLIVRYGSFQKLVKAASKWKEPVFIDIKGYYKGKKEVADALSRFGSMFVMVDPTDRNRNVAAALSRENLSRLIALSREFLSAPSEEFFFRTPPTFEERVAAEWGKGELYLLSMPRPEVVDDVLWGQINKLVGQLGSALKDFGPRKILPDDSRHLVRLAVILSKGTLPPTVQVAGPPLSMKKHVALFRASHPGSRFTSKDKKIHATLRRPVTDASDAIMRFFREYAKSRSHLSYHEEMLILEHIGRPGKKPRA
ncbi:MAG: CCA tRNA nucleotidyltransferase [Candidatus Micrarchaeia archaeon]